MTWPTSRSQHSRSSFSAGRFRFLPDRPSSHPPDPPPALPRVFFFSDYLKSPLPSGSTVRGEERTIELEQGENALLVVNYVEPVKVPPWLVDKITPKQWNKVLHASPDRPAPAKRP